MTTASMTGKEISEAKKRGFQWIVYAAYAHKHFERGDVISRHKSYDAACRAARGQYAQMRGVADVAYIDPNDEGVTG